MEGGRGHYIVTVCMWKSKNNSQVLISTLWVSSTELRLLGWAANAFAY